MSDQDQDDNEEFQAPNAFELSEAVIAEVEAVTSKEEEQKIILKVVDNPKNYPVVTKLFSRYHNMNMVAIDREPLLKMMKILGRERRITKKLHDCSKFAPWLWSHSTCDATTPVGRFILTATDGVWVIFLQCLKMARGWLDFSSNQLPASTNTSKLPPWTNPPQCKISNQG